MLQDAPIGPTCQCAARACLTVSCPIAVQDALTLRVTPVNAVAQQEGLPAHWTCKAPHIRPCRLADEAGYYAGHLANWVEVCTSWEQQQPVLCPCWLL